MRGQYGDMYALFRHDPAAEAYFEALPEYVKDRMRPLYRKVDTFRRLTELVREQQSRP